MSNVPHRIRIAGAGREVDGAIGEYPNEEAAVDALMELDALPVGQYIIEPSSQPPPMSEYAAAWHYGFRNGLYDLTPAVGMWVSRDAEQGYKDGYAIGLAEREVQP